MSRHVLCGNFEYETRKTNLELLLSKYGRVERVDMKPECNKICQIQVFRLQHVLIMFANSPHTPHKCPTLQIQERNSEIWRHSNQTTSSDYWDSELKVLK
ncbi:hypothetical protein ACET3Z_018462 [Daucus carota]